MSMMVSFVLSFFPRDVLDEILNLIGSVSEGFPSYSCPLSSSGAAIRGHTGSQGGICTDYRSFEPARVFDHVIFERYASDLRCGMRRRHHLRPGSHGCSR